MIRANAEAMHGYHTMKNPHPIEENTSRPQSGDTTSIDATPVDYIADLLQALEIASDTPSKNLKQFTAIDDDGSLWLL